MRLIDQLRADAGSDKDQMLGGPITSLATALADAQCFELSADVVEACQHVALSRPSSLVSALPMTRVPYPRTWFEWQPRHDDGSTPPTETKPRPARIGCLIEAEEGLARGMMTWAWHHTGYGCTVLPYGVQFDWRPDADVPAFVRQIAAQIDKIPALKFAELRRGGFAPDAEMLRLYAAGYELDEERAGRLMRETQRWGRLAGDHRERVAVMHLVRHAMAAPSQHCVALLLQLGGLDEATRRGMLDSWHEDLSGEPDFALAFVIMLNARHALDRTPEDFAKLNQRRKRLGRPPLAEFVTTRLALSPGRARGIAGDAEKRAEARRHLVRGHFKVRSSGIFWWSPFVRGSGIAVPREAYRVNP
jgi:hypothetical protein